MLEAISMSTNERIIFEQSVRTELTTKVVLEVITRWLRQEPIDEPTIQHSLDQIGLRVGAEVDGRIAAFQQKKFGADFRN